MPVQRIPHVPLTLATLPQFVTVTSGGCWEWKGARTLPAGYGIYRRRLAHRLALELSVGPLPTKILACHHCDNPPCVRPDHLFPGSYADNMRDCVRKGRNYNGVRKWLAQISIPTIPRAAVDRFLIAKSKYARGSCERLRARRKLDAIIGPARAAWFAGGIVIVRSGVEIINAGSDEYGVILKVLAKFKRGVAA
jgi:hypothetical protein